MPDQNDTPASDGGAQTPPAPPANTLPTDTTTSPTQLPPPPAPPANTPPVAPPPATAPSDDDLLADFKAKKIAYMQARDAKAAQDAVVEKALADQVTLRDAETAARAAMDAAAEALIGDIKAQE